MTKQYEVLAAEGTADTAARKLIEETRAKFAKTQSYFSGIIRRLSMMADTVENKAVEATEFKDLQLTTTVVETLEYALGVWADAENLRATKNRGNQSCVADIVVEGETILTNVPVDEIMGLESRLGEFKKLFSEAPSLQAGQVWTPDLTSPLKGAYIGSEETTTKTQAGEDVIIDVQPTDKHPAQTRRVAKTSVIGTFKTTLRSGALTTIQKAELLKMTDKLIIACRQARNRANDRDVENFPAGTAIVAKLLSVLA